MRRLKILMLFVTMCIAPFFFANNYLDIKLMHSTKKYMDHAFDFDTQFYALVIMTFTCLILLFLYTVVICLVYAKKPSGVVSVMNTICITFLVL